MMSADDCRDLAKWYRARADDDDKTLPGRAARLRSVAHSLSSLATQLETMAHDAPYRGADIGLQIVQPPAGTRNSL
jgi:hypothetical protein